MRRLYLRIYFAVLASVIVLALAAGFLWRQLSERGPEGRAFEVASTLAQNALPPPQAPRIAQQAALEKLAANLKADVSLYGADRLPLARVGRPLPPPGPDRESGGWLRDGRGRPAWALRLPDGRWLVARTHRNRPHPALGLFITLGLLALAVGIGAYPVVRRLTRRLENLQHGVESLGAGDLAARVRVEGRDEVAQLAESFNRAAARIEALVGAHKSLLANASHELRTPLTRIRMAIELMKDSAAPPRRRALEQDIAELDALIDEILLAGSTPSGSSTRSRRSIFSRSRPRSARATRKPSSTASRSRCAAIHACCDACCAICSRTRGATARRRSSCASHRARAAPRSASAITARACRPPSASACSSRFAASRARPRPRASGSGWRWCARSRAATAVKRAARNAPGAGAASWSYCRRPALGA
jgi:HAMP domain-containing protein